MLGLLKLVFFLRIHHLHQTFVLIHLLYKTLQVILNEFLNTLDEASVSPNVHRNRLDTFIHQKKNVTSTDNRLSGYFCSETIFNLSNRMLTDTEISVLEKGLNSTPIEKKLNEPERRSDFNDFCRRMRLK